MSLGPRLYQESNVMEKYRKYFSGKNRERVSEGRSDGGERERERER